MVADKKKELYEKQYRKVVQKVNGQIYQICNTVAAAKNAMKSATPIIYKKGQYENSIEFQFLQEKKLFGSKDYKAKNIESWYNYCMKKGMQDIKLIMPVAVKNRGILGFSNSSQQSLVCFYKKQVTYFTAHWEFDSIKNVWDILYTEAVWKEAPLGKPQFSNNTESLEAVLIKIRDLAYNIDFDFFALIFQKSLDILSGAPVGDEKYSEIPLPNEHLRLFNAAGNADVFGAMGSWNDSPPYMAEKKGLREEYESLSDELLKQIRLAILFAVNEW